MMSTRFYASQLSFASTVVRILSKRVSKSGKRIETVLYQNTSDLQFYGVAINPSSSSSSSNSSNNTSTTKPLSSRTMATATVGLNRNKRAPITVTERAAARIQEILSNKRVEQQEQPPVGIRLSVKRRGCNGYSYTLNYVHSESEYPKDEIVHASNNVTIFIDPMALFSIVGTRMDWVDTELTSEFTFENPNSKGECGCGESFTV